MCGDGPDVPVRGVNAFLRSGRLMEIFTMASPTAFE